MLDLIYNSEKFHGEFNIVWKHSKSFIEFTITKFQTLDFVDVKMKSRIYAGFNLWLTLKSFNENLIQFRNTINFLYSFHFSGQLP